MVASAGRMRIGESPRFLLASVIGSLPPIAVIAVEWRFGPGLETPLNLALALIAISYPLWLTLLGIGRSLHFVTFLFAFGALLGVISYISGAANGLTDEPYTTPLYVNILLQGHNPYAVLLVLTYVQYGVHSTVSSFYVYLPLLMFLQIPFLDYKLFSALCWVGIVWLVRKDFYSAVALAQPFVALMAFNGYNDLAPLLLLTVGFVGWKGQRQRWAQAVALGTKQFASVFVLVYYVLRKDWRTALLSAIGTVAILAPFIAWNWHATICQAVLYDIPSGCRGGGFLLLFHIDYGLWPLWAFAIFYVPIIAFLQARLPRLYHVLVRLHE